MKHLNLHYGNVYASASDSFSWPSQEAITRKENFESSEQVTIRLVIKKFLIQRFPGSPEANCIRPCNSIVNFNFMLDNNKFVS